MDVIVVGGGVMGASVAYQLALRGRRSVVLEAETLAHGASGNAAGLVSPPRAGGSCMPRLATAPILRQMSPARLSCRLQK